MTDEERITRGRRAKSELALTQEAFEALEQDFYRRMKETSPENPERVLHFHRSINNLAAVKKALMLVVVDGNAVAAIMESGLSKG